MRAVMASISAASSGVKNSNLGGVAACAAWRACVAAERSAGQFAESHAALRPVPARHRKLRRLGAFFVLRPNFPGVPHVSIRRILFQDDLEWRRVSYLHPSV